MNTYTAPAPDGTPATRNSKRTDFTHALLMLNGKGWEIEALATSLEAIEKVHRRCSKLYSASYEFSVVPVTHAPKGKQA